jgi:CheY-like chemotaxis protein
MKTVKDINTLDQNDSVDTVKDTSLPDTSEFLIEKEMALPSDLPILVFEEDEMSRLLMGYILYHSNISFEVASSVQEVREKLDKKKFSLVIAGINGQEPDLSAVLEQKIPVLVVTASTRSKEIEHYLEKGYEDVLTEPFEEKIFIQLIYKHMKKPYDNTESTNATETAHVPSFSLEPLQRVCKNDNAFVLKMLDKFKISVQECTDGMSSGDPTKMRTSAHKSIPSYSIMGLDQLVKDLVFIEHHIELDSDKEKAQQLAHSVIERNKTILQDADAYMEQLKQLNT